jgi:GNAT superfamily N-acetyltransferase
MLPNEIKSFPLKEDHFSDWLLLMGDRGGCGGCFCMSSRIPKKQFEQDKGERNKQSFRDLMQQGKASGLLFYLNEEGPVAWLSAGPLSALAYLPLQARRKNPAAEQTWAISCFFIKKTYRGQGLSSIMLKQAEELARANGAVWLEGIGVASEKPLPGPFMWTGILKVYLKHGYEILEGSASRKLLRKKLC